VFINVTNDGARKETLCFGNENETWRWRKRNPELNDETLASKTLVFEKVVLAVNKVLARRNKTQALRKDPPSSFQLRLIVTHWFLF